MTAAEHELDLKLTRGTPNLALMGELWGASCEEIGENWPCYEGTLCGVSLVVTMSSDILTTGQSARTVTSGLENTVRSSPTKFELNQISGLSENAYNLTPKSETRK